MSEALTQKDSMSRLMVEPVQAVSLQCSEVRIARMGRDGERNQVAKHVNSRWREKVLVYCIGARTANRRRWARRES